MAPGRTDSGQCAAECQAALAADSRPLGFLLRWRGGDASPAVAKESMQGGGGPNLPGGEDHLSALPLGGKQAVAKLGALWG